MSTTNELIMKVQTRGGEEITKVTLPLLNYSSETAATIVANVKNKITAFNTAAADSTSAVYQTFTLDAEQPVKGITEATVRVQTEEVIYDGD